MSCRQECVMMLRCPLQSPAPPNRANIDMITFSLPIGKVQQNTSQVSEIMPQCIYTTQNYLFSPDGTDQSTDPLSSIFRRILPICETTAWRS